MTEISELAEEVVELVGRLGGKVCDVLVADTRVATAEVEKGSIKQASYLADPGIAIRVFENGSPGFAYCTSQSAAEVNKAAELAISMARAGVPDPDFKALPGPSSPAAVDGLYDEKVAKLKPEEAVDILLRLVDEASADDRISSVNGGLMVSTGEVALANSNGLAAGQRMTSFDVFAEAVARSGDVMFSGMDYASSRKLDSDAPTKVGLSAREHAVKGLAHRKMQTGDYPVILDPLAAGYIISSAIGSGANAESIQRGRSYLAGKLDTNVGSEALTVYDDPTLEWAIGSTSFDGEGVTPRRKAVIEDGTLKTYLYDSYTAGKDSVESTGNSSRGGAIWSYRHPPGISSANLVVNKGDASLDEMVKDCGQGVYLRVTFDSPNLATGEFSCLIMEGYVIENGEIGPAIRQSTMGIGLLDMFSKVDLIGSCSRHAFGVETPAMRISSARVGGSG